MPVSGKDWVKKFPTSESIDDLSPGFRDKVQGFVDALKEAKATISVNATRRPKQRAYMMHFSWLIAKKQIAPADATPFKPAEGEEGVDIQWVHKKANGSADVAASRAGAQEMVDGFEIGGGKVAPALNSNHIRGTAIDMTVSWSGTLSIKTKSGKTVAISSTPRSSVNPDLIAVAKTYGVIHFSPPAKDPPHWSLTGG
jgi:hypothetical protein